MRRLVMVMLGVGVAAGLLGGVPAASAHECPEGEPPDSDACEETDVYDDWRPNYVPLFDLSDREHGEPGSAPEQRGDAQRWREECADDGQERQQCQWLYGGTSVQEYPSDPEGEAAPRPNELHVGYAANHCFLAEAAHDCDGHDEGEFGTHDSHGGAIYVDICLSANPDSKYCDDGMEDTQAGVTIVDHLTCPMGCFDEYHVVRPLDAEYTEDQMGDSAAAAEQIASDPRRHVCGYEEQGSSC